ncbi:MAG: tetratricopeptide repeat protein, partial [Pyrinomonadaceae bacterium]
MTRTFIFKYILLLVALMLAAAAVPAQNDSDQAIAIFNHGQDLHEKGDLAGAIAEYDKALKALPEFPEAEYQRAAAEMVLGNLAEAEASLRRATELRQDWSLAWGMLGDVLVRKYSADEAASRPEMLKDADAALKKALELD